MKTNHDMLAGAFPQTPQGIDRALMRAFEQIHRETAATPPPRYARRLSFATVVLLVLLLAAIGVAAGVHYGVLDLMTRMLGQPDALPQANELVQSELCALRVGHTGLRVTEAVYDGQAVRLVLHVQNDTIRRPLTEAELYGDGALTEALAQDGVTALGGFDWFTIDGAEHGMTGGSGGQSIVGENDGEAVVYFELLLTQSEGELIEAPTRDFVLGLPVRRAQSTEERQMRIPIKVVAQNLLRDITPDAPIPFGEGANAYTVTVTEAKLSPIRNAVALRVDVPDTVDDDAAWEAISPWYDIALVDAHGAEIGTASPSYWGLPAGESDDLRHFAIRIETEPQETHPPRLFVAPVGVDGADMTLAIELDMEGTA